MWAPLALTVMSNDHPSATPSIFSLPLEIYDLIASCLPVQIRSSTLLALALTTTHIYKYVQPLLYGQIIVKTESESQAVLDRLMKEKNLGLLVRELHIMTCLLALTQKPLESTLLRKLHAVVKAGRLPHLQILGLVLLPGWFRHDGKIDFKGNDHLPYAFWTDLKFNCPQLRGVFLQGIGDSADDPWLDKSGLFELDELSVCTCIVWSWLGDTDLSTTMA